jgi:N-acetylneuraminate synthase/N,N'-diacetyllegionaminate synthase
MAAVDVGGRLVGPGHPCFVIAEAGVNHNGDLDLGRELVRVAANAGADAVKFQTFSAERLVTASAPKAAYQVERTDPSETQQAMLKHLELGIAEHRELMKECERHGILFLSSAFDEESADLLEKLGVVAYKIPSGEITNLPYLRHLASKGRCLIVSTGMSDLDEVKTCVEAIRETADVPIVLLHCVSLYPAPAAGSNLRAMDTMRAAFGFPVGYSDHTEGIAVALAAVAMGADMIEKHLTTDRTLPGPDHAASLEPAELRGLIDGIRAVESARGDGVKRPLPAEAATAAVARKSIVATIDIPKDMVIRQEMLVLKRPGTGMPPSQLAKLIGRKARVAIPAGTVITPEMV